MKPLCLTLGLLVLTVCYCNAVPMSLWSPSECCFNFYTSRIPKRQIIDIKKSGANCVEKAFVVHTATGRKFCLSQNEEWVQAAFNQLQRA